MSSKQQQQQNYYGSIEVHNNPTTFSNLEEQSQQAKEVDGLLSDTSEETTFAEEEEEQCRWKSSGVGWRDFLHFVGPGWFVCIAYVDPGNYQADIQAGATSRYRLLWTVWWASVLSIYIQSLCVRLAYYGQVTLAEVQAMDLPRRYRYLNWFIAEFSAVITDLPEVIGIGIAFNIFFGWPYYVGVLLSLLTTMSFLATIRCGMRVLEVVVVVFVGIMSVVLFMDMAVIGVDRRELIKGWTYGFVDTTSDDLFSVTGIVGCVVMPHNLYLHTSTCQSRPVQRDEATVEKAVRFSSWEPVLPVLVSFFINTAIVSIAAETEFFEDSDPRDAGIAGFCRYLGKAGTCVLFGIALVSAGQSSAITTTYTGQYVMDGFLDIRLPVWARAILTRFVAIVPCIVVAVAFPDRSSLNVMINFVNSALAFLLPFGLTPLIKYNCSTVYMGKHAAGKYETFFLYLLGFAVYLLNAIALSAPGGGFFGDIISAMEGWSATKVGWILLSLLVQVFYLVWNVHCILMPVSRPMRPLEEERRYLKGQFAPAGDCVFLKGE